MANTVYIHGLIPEGFDNGSLRASAYLYNTEDEARLFAETFAEAVHAFSAS